MSCIKTHDVTLRGGCEKYTITLRPTSDADIALLQELNSDPAALALADPGGDMEPYTEDMVRKIWGPVSQHALCFIVEADGVAVGDCWLQEMNLPAVREKYKPGTDVRRIDMSIGRVSYWNQGIGTAMIRMLMDFAFTKTTTDVLHCICDESNIRSNRVWQKNGFRLAWQEPGEECGNHYALTREEYLSRK